MKSVRLSDEDLLLPFFSSSPPSSILVTASKKCLVSNLSEMSSTERLRFLSLSFAWSLPEPLSLLEPLLLDADILVAGADEEEEELADGALDTLDVDEPRDGLEDEGYEEEEEEDGAEAFEGLAV